MAPLNILIVGCGIAGSTLATCLLLSPQQQHPHITIVERSPEMRAQGQNIDVRGSGITIMRKLGMERAIRASTTGEEGVQIVDSNNYAWAAFAADRSGQVSTPTADIEILRGRLAEICYLRSKSVSEQVRQQAAAASVPGSDGSQIGIEYVFGDYLDELEQDGSHVHVHFAKSGQRRSFDLVVGADGLQSRTRSMVWGSDGEEYRIKRLGMYAGFFSMPKGPTDSLWRRWFHAPGRRGIMLRPDQQNDRTTVLMTVINEKDSRLPDIATAIATDERGRKGGVEAQKALMAEYFRDVGWESKRVVKEMMAADDFYYDLVGQVKMDRWSKGRVILLGDAGYCASPISGMGTTLAFEGAWHLAGALTRHFSLENSDSDFGAAFAEYEAKMRPTVDEAQKLAPGVPHLVNPETVWGVWILHAIAGLLYWSGLVSILFKYAGPATKEIPVEDYGFRQLDEMETDGRAIIST